LRAADSEIVARRSPQGIGVYFFSIHELP
jgi:hypothetical protein